MEEFRADVVIVGAGPAGATAAYFLAQLGVDVVMVDQAIFPRSKPCGDRLGYEAVLMLQKMGLGSWLRQGGFNRCTSFLLSAPDGTKVRASMPPDVADTSYGVPREVLDDRLVEVAVAAGAHFHPGTRCVELHSVDEYAVRLQGEREAGPVAYRAPLLIAADGGQATFTRALGLATGPPEGMVVRAYYEGATGDPGQFEVHWEPEILPAYGWLFPSGEATINVGLGAYTRDVIKNRLALQSMLETFITVNPFAQDRLAQATRATPITGHPLRTDAPEVIPCADNVLVVGEAAGVVNPLTGEGIGPSMVSGEMAAQYAQQAFSQGDFSLESLAAYGRAFHNRFDRSHRAARRARALIARPWILRRVLRTAARHEAYAGTLARILLGQVQPTTLSELQMLLKLVFT